MAAIPEQLVIVMGCRLWPSASDNQLEEVFDVTDIRGGEDECSARPCDAKGFPDKEDRIGNVLDDLGCRDSVCHSLGERDTESQVCLEELHVVELGSGSRDEVDAD